MKETRPSFNAILGYHDLFSGQESKETAFDLIKGLPSIRLLTNISVINFELFLSEDRTKFFNTQLSILNWLMEGSSEAEKLVFTDPLIKYWQEHNVGVYFYRQSNLKMYDLILQSWNHSSDRKLTPDETGKFLQAYLLINTEIRDKLKLDNQAFKEALNSNDKDPMTDLFIVKFIYQTDYKRNHDFSIQTVRGSLFFEYLANSEMFGDHLRKYLNWHRTKNATEYLYNIVALISKAIEKGPLLQPSPLVNFITAGNTINHRLLSRISINEKLIAYRPMDDFKALRKFPIYKFSNKQYLVLDTGFLMDKLYKNVVFTFNDHLKQNNFAEPFLSLKGKQFTEELLFYPLISRCFNEDKYQLFSGKITKLKLGKELCDYYIRSDNRIALIELKDVLLGSETKNAGIAEDLFQNMDLKFVSNQKKSPKGVRQLVKAVEKLNSGIDFDTIDTENIEIYPIICYTDYSFGFDGINRHYNKIFQETLAAISISKKFKINPLVFMSLDFFQHFEDSLNNETIDFFGLIKGYYEHIKMPGYEAVTFEVFVGSYVNDAGKPTEISKLGKERLVKIMNGS